MIKDFGTALAGLKDSLPFQIATGIVAGLTTVFKAIEITGKYWSKFRKQHDLQSVQSEILRHQTLRQGAPADAQAIIDQQLEALYTRYVLLASKSSQPAQVDKQPVYPTLPQWRKALLLFWPATKRTLIPQALFFLLIGSSSWSALARVIDGSFALTDFLGVAVSFLWLLLFGAVLWKWAKLSELPRRKLSFLQRVTLLPVLVSSRAKGAKACVILYWLSAIGFFLETFWIITELLQPPTPDWRNIAGFLALCFMEAAILYFFHDVALSLDAGSPGTEAPQVNENILRAGA